MNTFSKLYDTELHNQEIKSNKRTLMGFCWFFLTLLLVWVLTMINFFLISKFLISLSLGFTVLLLISPVIIYKKADLSSPWIKYLFLALISIICSIITALLTYHAVLIFVMPLLFAIQYRKRQALWFSFIFNTITMFISSYVGFYYGLCDLNLLLESTHTRNWYLQTMSGSFLQIPFNENPVFIIAVFEVLPRTLILLIFTIMLQYTIISSHNDALRIAELTYRKDMDARTKLYNKNKYEDMAVNYYPSVGYIAVAFWDLNNLKMINDNFGHAVGDSLIQTMSEKLLAVSNERCRTYRVGGDGTLFRHWHYRSPYPCCSRFGRRMWSRYPFTCKKSRCRHVFRQGKEQGGQIMIYILTACLVLVFLLFFTSYLLYRGVFYYPQKKHVDPYQIPDDMLYAPYKNAMLHLLHEMEQTPYEEVSIRSQDGLSLCGRLYLFRPDAPLMLFFHGYHGTFLWDGLGSFRFCRKNHINLLVVDERSHGKSADQIITFGIRECKDVKCWADYAAKRFPEKSLILSGVSMGSASVMMASVLSLPSSVKALICDCGYTAPAEIIKETIRSFHLPVSFCYALLHFGARIFGHFNLSESTALSAVKQTKLPILFIHGDHDSIVPPKMCDELYDACASRKKKLIITGSQHAVNAMADFDSYEREIMNFLKESGIKI